MADHAHPNLRAAVLGLFAGQRPAQVPCFSGLIHVTTPGLESLGLELSSLHHDAAHLAAAALSTYRLAGWASAVAPADLCVEAEVLGATLDFRAGTGRPEFPFVARPAAESAGEYQPGPTGDLSQRGRLPVVLDALRRMRAEAGEAIALGGMVPGPFTLALQMIAPGNLLAELVKTPETVAGLLDQLVPVLAEVAGLYRTAGADFITVHEMGGSPGFIGPRRFEQLVWPPLQQLLRAIPAPRVLSVCGRLGRALPLFAELPAEALSVDQTTDLAAARAQLAGGRLLFGNLDPVGVLADGTEAEVRGAVAAALAAGVDAVWPGCDLYPPVLLRNLTAMREAAGG